MRKQPYSAETLYEIRDIEQIVFYLPINNKKYLYEIYTGSKIKAYVLREVSI